MNFKLTIFFIISIIINIIYAQDHVVLLHGLARTNRSFNKMESVLKDSGYCVINYNYPSTKYKIEKLAEDAISQAIEEIPDSSTIHFVTHSLGGILVRQYLENHLIEKMGNVVMLGPPNKGSQVIDKIHMLPGFNLLNGEAGYQLGTGENSVPNKLGPADFNVGIIAGTRSINLILSTMLPDTDDGKVTVENTRLEGMTDHITLPITHPMMMRNNTVIQQVLYFLKHSEFNDIKNKK